MGLFSIFKRMFSKTITIPKYADDRLISIGNTKGQIKVSSMLKVPENFVAIIVTKGKVCDVFTNGEYELTPGMMQKANRVRKLSIPNKKGDFKKNFKGIIYFINLREFNEVEFQSYKGVSVKEKGVVNTVVSLEGKYSYKIINPKKFLETLLLEYYSITGLVGEKQLSLWVGEYVDKRIQNEKPLLKDMVSVSEEWNEIALVFLKKHFDGIGINILDVKINNIVLPKKAQKMLEKINDISCLNVPINKPEKLQPTLREFQLKNQIENFQQEEIVEEIKPSLEIKKESKKTHSDYEISDGILVAEMEEETLLPPIKKSSVNFEDEIEEFVPNNTNDFYMPLQNEEPLSWSPDEKDIKASIDEDDFTAEVISYKKCLNCGTLNPLETTVCTNCNKCFSRKCSNCGEDVPEGEFVCLKCKSLII